MQEQKILAEMRRKNIEKQVKHQSLRHWGNDQLAIQMLQDAWHATLKSDRVKGERKHESSEQDR
ncbi:hypothetical protein AB0Y04_01040 [Loigolactobacillus coryniformis]|uniref:hypothetical protein n=1 Tax=Loigolactobacillus coryniformis TaxID=1610 RepID=UPI003F292B14